MTRTEHLLTILAEECAEVAQECSKALRFGLDDMYSGVSVEFRISKELNDLRAVVDMLVEAGVLSDIAIYDPAATARKAAKVEEFLAYSAERGRLTGERCD